jgi:pimeloyl-ACP methyl ester carboxylesterase
VGATSRVARRVVRWATLAILAVAVVSSTACGSGRDVPSPPPSPDATAISIATSDGLLLDGRLFASSETHLLIFLHAYADDQSDWFAFAGEVARGGRASALTYDFRGYGESEGERATDERLLTDVQAAISFGRSHGYASIALVGAGMGGTAAIITAVEDPAIHGVIALSAPAYFGDLDAMRALRSRKPFLALIAARDDVSAVDAMRMMGDDTGLAPRYRYLVVGEASGTDLFTSIAGADVRRRIQSLLVELWDRP